MKKQISPAIIVGAVIVVALVVGALYMRAGSQEQYGAKMPEVVLKEFQEKGPRPMPPVPMPGGGTAAPQPGATGVPTAK